MIGYRLAAMIFDRYLVVDWSARNRPGGGKDSVWVCVLDAAGRISTQNPRTRGRADVTIRAWCCPAPP